MPKGRVHPATALVVSLVAATSGGCDATRPETVADEAVVAEDRLGPIERQDLDRLILSLPPDERSPGDVERVDWYASLARRVAVERILLDEAKLAGIDQDPRFRALVHRLERRHFVDDYLRGRGEIETPSEEELRAVYDERRAERYQWPERRETYHLYKRWGGAEERERVVAEVEVLRARVMEGEQFPELAREHSDSEARHRSGLLGTVERGQFPEDFDRVVFALQEEVPSEVLVAGDGAHLFYVAHVHEARELSFDEVKTVIRREVMEDRRLARLEEIASDLPVPEDSFLPDRDDVRRILSQGDGSALVLRVGDFALTTADVGELLRAHEEEGRQTGRPDSVLRLVEETRYREVIYQHLEREGLLEALSPSIEQEKERHLVDFFGRQRLTALLSETPERVRRHHENNAMRFATPVRVDLTILTLPRDDVPPSLMGELEGSRVELDAGAETLEDLADRLGAEVRATEALTAADLQRLGPFAVRFGMRLAPGEHSPPFQLADALTMFRVDRRREPEAQPLATQWDRVVGDLVASYSGELFEELSAELLAESGFRLYRERLAALGPLVGS